MPGYTGEGRSRQSGGGDQGWRRLERQEQVRQLGRSGRLQGRGCDHGT